MSGLSGLFGGGGAAAGWLRAPALHFLVIGGLLYAWTSLAAVDARPRRDPIVFTRAQVEAIRDDYRLSMGADPTPAELDALIASTAEEEMLYREALLLGLDIADSSVEFHVVEKMRFLFGDAAGDNLAAYKRGRELGLHREDPTVRNALATKMRLLGKAASRSDEPRGAALDAALEAYLRDHRDDYVAPATVSVAHVFLGKDKRGAALQHDARELRARLVAAEPGLDPARTGDPFPVAVSFTGVARDGLAKVLGDAIADAAFALEPGRWSEPLRSPYGLHLLRVDARTDARVPELSAVRSRVLTAYRAQRHAEFVDRMLAELRAHYEVRVEEDADAAAR